MYKVTEKKFEALVEEGLAAIPKRFLKKLDNVAVITAAHPSRAQNEVGRGDRSLLLGLYEGVPQTSRWGYNLALPDKITIFKAAIEALADSEADIKQLVRDTVWHELAHHFGMDEKRVRRAEKKREGRKG